MIRIIIFTSLILFQTPTHAMDLCDSSGGDFEIFQDIQQAISLPKVKAEYALNADCQYTVKTVADISSNKSLADFMGELISKDSNTKSANKNLQNYEMKQVGDNAWEQTVKASKSGVNATIVNSCRYTTLSANKMVFTCGLKGANKYIEKNTTSIACENGSSGIKKCIFETVGKAKPYTKLGITLKNACDLAAGGAAETVNGVARLAQYISNGKVDENKWAKPGADFYTSAKNIQSKKPAGFKMDIFR